MTIAEITFFELASNPEPYFQFVFKYKPYYYNIADYWSTTFGTGESDVHEFVFINAIVQDYTISYSKALTLELCKNLEKYYYWDIENQELYIHFDHDFSPETCVIEIGKATGFSSDSVVYIDNIGYSPLILNSPKFRQQEDILRNNKLSLMSGNLELNNLEGINDIFINTNVYGNDVSLFYLDNEIENPSRSDLEAHGVFLIDNLTIGLQKISLALQDKRIEQDIDIPVDFFTLEDYEDIDEQYVNKKIPVAYGTIRASEAIPIDGNDSGTVTFRQAILLTTLGTVQIKANDEWVTKVPVSSDLATGTFVLAQADAREGGAAFGKPFQCQVLNSVGIAITSSADIIVDLNERFLDIAYSDSGYNTAEWTAESAFLSPIGIVFNETIKLYDAIKLIQDGSNVGFRYERDLNGLRTIRVNNWIREKSNYVHYEDILNQATMNISLTRENIAATVIIKYAKNYTAGTYLTEKNESNKSDVLQNYRVQPTLELETALVTKELAAGKASWISQKFSIIHGIGDFILLGKDFLSIRIYDIIEIDISPESLEIPNTTPNRLFFGRWKAQVLAFDPDLTKLVNKIKLLLIEQIEITSEAESSTDSLRIIEDGTYRITEDGQLRSTY